MAWTVPVDEAGLCVPRPHDLSLCVGDKSQIQTLGSEPTYVSSSILSDLAEDPRLQASRNDSHAALETATATISDLFNSQHRAPDFASSSDA